MIRVQTEDFDPGAELARLRRDNRGRAGAMVSFIGLVRDMNEGADIGQITLEHYPGMTEKALSGIEQEAHRRWELSATLIVHRYGTLLPNDRIVLVIAASTHRKNAFRACEYMIDTLKTGAPFWKKESTTAGERWVGAGSTTSV